MDARHSFDAADVRSRFPRFTPDALAANQSLIVSLTSISERKNARPAQIALAWLLAQKSWIVRSRALESSHASRKTFLRPTSNSPRRICTTSIRPPRRCPSSVPAQTVMSGTADPADSRGVRSY
jgi:hypothetical protein